MAVITLTSDWGTRDHFAASVKGMILQSFPAAQIVDVTHEVPAYDLNTASFLLQNAYPCFPKGSIHIIGMNTEASTKTPHTAVYADGHYFIGADNGIFSLLLEDKIEKIVELELFQDSDYFTFPSRDIFAKAAAKLAQGEKIESLGIERDKVSKAIHFAPVVDNDLIKGIVIYVNNYRNVITNVKHDLFNEVGKGRAFKLEFSSYVIDKLSTSYNDVPLGEILAFFGSNGYLHIAQNGGKAADLLGLSPKDSIRIEFKV